MKEFVFIPDEPEIGNELNQTYTLMSDALGTLGVSETIAEVGNLPASADADVVPLGAMSAPPVDNAHKLNVVDVVPESGAMHVTLDDSEDDVLPTIPGGTLHPMVDYELAVPLRVRVGRRAITKALGPPGAEFFKIKIVSKNESTGKDDPVANVAAHIVLPDRQQFSAVTDHYGNAEFSIRVKELHQVILMVEPGFNNHWGYFERKVDMRTGDRFYVEPIDLASRPDALRLMGSPLGQVAGAGVKVGVIDTGVGNHVDLPNVQGDIDSSLGHGTHVAGIIASHATNGGAGVASQVQIQSYRVFRDPEAILARNFNIHSAIFRAIQDGCHIINLSLKTGAAHEFVVGSAVKAATDAGILCFAAAGNDSGGPVAFPARHPDCISVAACGHLDGLPDTAYDRWTLSSTKSSTDKKVFFGKFSNIGDSTHPIDLIAPGAGIVSTVPGNKYAPMSGTSMACPAAVGAAARILSNNAHILNVSPTRARRDNMWDLVRAQASSAGFETTHEGHGLVAYALS